MPKITNQPELTPAMQRLLNPKNRAEQVVGVVEFYDSEFKIITPYTGLAPASFLYYMEVVKLAAYMFTNRHICGYRYEVIRRYLADMSSHTFDPNAEPLSMEELTEYDR